MLMKHDHVTCYRSSSVALEEGRGNLTPDVGPRFDYISEGVNDDDDDSDDYDWDFNGAIGGRSV